MTGLPIFIISIIGIVSATIAAVVWRNKSSHKFLLSLFVFLMMTLLLVMTIVANYGEQDNNFINLISLLFFVILLMIPPSMYLYVKHYLSENTAYQTLNDNIRHYFPAIALGIVNVTAFILIIRNPEDSIYSQVPASTIEYANAIALLFIFTLQNIFYIYLATKKYKEHRNQIDELFSFSAGTPLQWVREFIIGYGLLMLTLYLQTAQVFGNQNWTFALFVVGYIGYTLYKGFGNPSFSELIADAEKSAIATPTPNVIPVQTPAPSTVEKEILIENKAPKSLISEELQNQIWQSIQELMTNENVYTDQDLTVYSLAKMAGTNSKYLRITIQKKFGKNFANYVNSFRVEAAKILLLDPNQAHYNIEYIGEMAGFKSKSSFYAAFKQQTGFTPQAYRKEQQ